MPSRGSLVAGLIAGCTFVLIELLGRALFQVPTLPEVAQDRLLLAMPGPVFAFLLERLVYLGKPLFLAGLLLLQVAIGTLGGLVAARLGRPLVLAMVLWVLTGGLLAPLTGRGPFGGDPSVAVFSFLAFAAYGLVLRFWRRPDLQTTDGPVFRERLRLLAGGAVVLASGGLAWRVIANIAARAPVIESAQGFDALPASWAGVAAPRELPPPITAPEGFYIVSKNLDDPVVDPNTWHLQLTGLVDQPLELSYQALAALPSVQVIRTLECISNEVGGDLMSTGLWTGLPLGDLLGRAGVKDGATTLVFHSVDGYSETMPLAKALDPNTLLAYELDQQPLPAKHGFPVRVLGAGTYGMKNPKWLNQIDVVAAADPGFWEQQGWNPDAPVQTMARIDSPKDGGAVSGATQIGGVAFAADRGIQRVEVSTDGGTTWADAELLPSLGPSTWVFWRLDWQPTGSGMATLVARAVDGAGQPQTDRQADSFPNGSSGYHRIEVRLG
jgi:DMSO/TMAO reductase YedYZ molybdopterin-dependent catalytic subunit